MADFQHHLSELHALDARVVAASSDDEAGAVRTAESLHLEYPVLYGLDAAATSAAIGCYTGTHAGAAHVQPAAFVLDADGTIALATYSSGKVGRLTAQDAVTLAGDLKKTRT